MPKLRTQRSTGTSSSSTTLPYARPCTTTAKSASQPSPPTSDGPPDILRFFSGSKPVPPGPGPGERVHDPSVYTALAAIPHWRRVLSNFDSTTPFSWRNHQWASIEHAFQGAKMGLVNQHAMAAFALDSTRDDRGEFAHIGVQSALVARNSRKLLVLPPTKVREWGQMSWQVMEEIAREKYRACELGKQVLRETRGAQLWHAGPRVAPVRFEHLERIRDELSVAQDTMEVAVGNEVEDRERRAAEELGHELFEPIASESEDS
ncbi:hypothetical protein BCR44DRAFT_24703 [Catenaria anguillulae PL171]|uniref:Uncharacterized protein n=1 Tax=Catenaria anguillulae PL171 TaxID=765915 RepID=A0A1Y2I0Q6_9FUNG|nr:hypothetical protein BCR44DRAFT_24703 [Catenaria anguillulae PL171]